MPEEIPNNPTPETTTASPQGAQSTPLPQTQTETPGQRIAALAFPEGKRLPATRLEAEELERKQAGAAKTQAPAAPVTPPLTDEEAPPDGLSEKGKESWKQWKAVEKKKYVELENKYKAVTAEVENFKKNPQTKVEIKAPDDYEEIKRKYAEKEKEYAETSDKLKLLDLQNHPQFKQYFDTKYSAVFDTVKLLGGKEGDKLVELLKQPESDLRTQKLEEVFSTISPLYQSQLGAAILEYKKVEAERSNELAKGKENYSKFIAMQQENQRKQQEQARAQAEQALNSEIENATKNLPVFQKVEGNNEWNQKVDESLKTARQIFAGDLPLPELARAATWAAAAPLILQDSAAKGEQIKNLTAEITRLKGAQPKPGGGTDPKEPAMPENMSFGERIAWQARQGGMVK